MYTAKEKRSSPALGSFTVSDCGTTWLRGVTRDPLQHRAVGDHGAVERHGRQALREGHHERHHRRRLRVPHQLQHAGGCLGCAFHLDGAWGSCTACGSVAVSIMIERRE